VSAREPPDPVLELDRRCTIVEADDRAVQAGQVARADLLGDADDIPDAQRRQRRSRAHGEHEPPARLHGRGDRAETIVQIARRDRVEQRARVLERHDAPRAVARGHAATENPSLPTDAVSV
jgi:hypothetical protein